MSTRILGALLLLVAGVAEAAYFPHVVSSFNTRFGAVTLLPADVGVAILATPTPHNFLTGIDAAGAFSFAQPSFSDIAGLLPIAKIDPVGAGTNNVITYDGTNIIWAPPPLSLTLGNLDAQTGNAQGAALVSSVLSMQSASATVPGLVNNTTQTLAGAKTFSTSIASPTAFLDTIYDNTSAEKIDVANSKLYNISASRASVDWLNWELLDSNGNVSINWQGRKLTNASGNDVIAYGNMTLLDASSNTSVDWGLRTLNDSVGSVAASWSSSGLVITNNASAANLSGTNTGDVTLGTANGLSLSAQALSLGLASTSSTGALSSTDWNTFNSKGSGTVTAVSVASLNGLAGSSSGGATPTLTLSTSVSGILKGNGTAISAASSGTDYLSPTLTSNQFLLGNGSNVATAVTLSGDITTTNTGATAIGSNRVTNAQLAQAPTLTIKGNNTGGTANEADLTVSQVNTMLGIPSYVVPTVQTFTSGSGTYTLPSSPRVPLYIRILMIGSGGGGEGSGSASQGAGSTGGNTTFGSSLLTANAGGGANTTPPLGGTVTINSPAIKVIGLQGGTGGTNATSSVSIGDVIPGGGAGASSYFSGGAAGGAPGASGGSAIANTGTGGGGGGGVNMTSTQLSTGNGGAAGGFIEAIISGSSMVGLGGTAAYSVGSGGGGGTAGTNGFAGGPGASGVIIVEEFYQ